MTTLGAQPRPHTRLFDQVRPFIRDSTRRFLTLGLLNAAAGLAEAASLVLMVRSAIAIVDEDDSVELSMGLWSTSIGLGLLIVAALVATALSVLIRLPAHRVGAGLLAEGVTAARTETFDAYAQSSWEARADEDSGGLQYLVSTYADRVGGALSNVTTALASAFTLATFLLSALALAPLFATAVIAVMAASFALLQPFRRLVSRRSAGVAVLNRRVASIVAEASSVSKEAYVYGVGARQGHSLRKAQLEHAAGLRSTTFLRYLVPDVYRASFFGIILGGLALIGTATDVDLAAAGGVILLLLRSITYVKGLQTTSLALAESAPYLEDLQAQIDHYRLALPTAKEEPGVFERIEAHQVFFSYDGGDSFALRGATFSIGRGESVAIVGPSGSGKSTLVDVLLGLRPIWSGRLLVNGIDGSEVARTWWNDHVALVDQQPRLISGRVDDNIRFFRSIVSDDDVRRAAAHAHIDHVISALGGYGAELGPGGLGLSGGQKQRLAIARALAGHPDVVVLDEPTSALDRSSEREVVEALQSLRAEATLIVVSHRPSILRLCERVIVLVEGRVVADGSPAAVRGRNDYFEHMMSDEESVVGPSTVPTSLA